MREIKCPKSFFDTFVSVFLAGGISGCPPWQSELVQLLSCVTEDNFMVFNPRRNGVTNDASFRKSQIHWEHDHLDLASAIAFWFPCESICPITLFELGLWLRSDKPIFIGMHPDYQRRTDIEILVGLKAPDLKIVYSLTDLAEQIKDYTKQIERIMKGGCRW